jgi:hypothetical protein
MPLYSVTNAATKTTRLVEARNPSRALRHVVIDDYAVKAASAALVAKLMSAGVKLESVSDEQPETIEES